MCALSLLQFASSCKRGIKKTPTVDKDSDACGATVDNVMQLTFRTCSGCSSFQTKSFEAISQSWN